MNKGKEFHLLALDSVHENAEKKNHSFESMVCKQYLILCHIQNKIEKHKLRCFKLL